MNITNLGRLVGAGLLALSLSTLAPHAAAHTFSHGAASGWSCFVDCDADDADDARELALGLDAGSGRDPTWERVARSFFPGGSGHAGSKGTTFEGRAFTPTPTVTAAVPEPQTWALLLAGLAAVIFIGARKRRND